MVNGKPPPNLNPIHQPGERVIQRYGPSTGKPPTAHFEDCLVKHVQAWLGCILEKLSATGRVAEHEQLIANIRFCVGYTWNNQ